MTMPRRHGDPPEIIHDRNGFSWALPFGLGTISGRGWLSIVALVIVGALLAAGAFVWVIHAGFQAIAHDHGTMRESNDRLACIVTLNEQERRDFRSRPTAFPCWWLR